MSKPSLQILAVLLALCALSPRTATAGLTREPTGHLGATDSSPHNAINHAPSLSHATTMGSVPRCAKSHLHNHVALFQKAEAFSYGRNNPVNFVDPTGLNSVWLGGAGYESETVSYSKPIVEKMKAAGVVEPVYVPIGTSGGQAGNIALTLSNMWEPNDSPLTTSVTESVLNASNDSGGQRNIIGYSYGSTIGAQAALEMANDGIVVDNLVLLASPISSDSDLYKALTSHENILNVHRIDIPNDPFSNRISLPTLLDHGFENHFHYIHNDRGQQDDLARKLADTFGQ